MRVSQNRFSRRSSCLISSDRGVVNFLDRPFLMLTRRNVFAGLSTAARHRCHGECNIKRTRVMLFREWGWDSDGIGGGVSNPPLCTREIPRRCSLFSTSRWYLPCDCVFRLFLLRFPFIFFFFTKVFSFFRWWIEGMKVSLFRIISWMKLLYVTIVWWFCRMKVVLSIISTRVTMNEKSCLIK